MTVESGMLSGDVSMKVLSILFEGDKYGYQIIREFADRADNTFQLQEGTLYPLLHTLEQDGYIKSYTKETPAGLKRKFYRITGSGQKYVKKHMKSSPEGGQA